MCSARRLCYFALLIPACSHTPGATFQLSTPNAAEWIEVQNDHWRPIRLFLVSSHGRYFLGDIAAATVQRYRIPSEFAAGEEVVRFVADPVGSADEFSTDPVRLAGVNRLHWQLKKVLYNSRLHRE